MRRALLLWSIAFVSAPLGAPIGSAIGAPERSDESVDERMNASEADDAQPERLRTKANEVDLGFITMRFGAGFLVDYAAYSQNDPSKEQMSLTPDLKIRDARILLKGSFPHTKRWSYTLGYMYDGAYDDWFFRQTGLMYKLPELNGYLFFGRTKEGFSTSKIMVGYYGWTNERSAANDAFLPILADGVKWTGMSFDEKLVYNLGAFVGSVSDETYVKNDYQVAGRAVWLPLSGQKDNTVLHLAFEARWGAPRDGSLQYRSKPESNPAQSYAVDTGKFPANGSTMLGMEAYYRPGPLMLGSEYYFNLVSSPQRDNPFLHGGDVFAAYMLTGEMHPYNKRGAFFELVTPSRSVFKGGPGAWELVLRYSYVDLDSGLVEGGRFWRLSPMVNWYLSEHFRLELTYGYSLLDRFGTQGATHYFQTRLQFALI